MVHLDACKNVGVPYPECTIGNSDFGFRPELWTGIIFCVLFGLELLIHCGLLAYHRGYPRFMYICIIGAAGELAGWIARTQGHNNPYNWSAFVAQVICLILSPAFISAVNYIAFQHTMDVFGKKWSRIPRKWYVIGFCCGDITSLVVQAAGGALSAEATTPSEINTGNHVMIAGVTIQVAVTAPFLALFFDYNIRRLLEWKRAGIPRSQRPYRRVEAFVAAIGISTSFVLIRCIYRIVEMADGWSGYLATTEVFFDILDGLMITIAIAVFIPMHPAFWLPRDVGKGEIYNAADPDEIKNEKLPKRNSGLSEVSIETAATPAYISSHGSVSPA